MSILKKILINNSLVRLVLQDFLPVGAEFDKKVEVCVVDASPYPNHSNYPLFMILQSFNVPYNNLFSKHRINIISLSERNTNERSHTS
jgi:hypothetical protein